MKKKIIYMSIGEGTIHNGIHDSQIINLLQFIGENYKDKYEITLLQMVPLRAYLISKFFKRNYKNLLNSRIDKLNKSNVRYIYKVIPSNLKWGLFNSFINYSKYYQMISKMINKLIIISEFDIIHCRNYLTSKIIYDMGFAEKMIFDPRSKFPEEVFLRFNNKKEYKFWCEVEAELVKRSKTTITVSFPFKEYIQNKHNLEDEKVKVIPLFGKRSNSIDNQLMTRSRTIVYLGSMSGGYDKNLLFDYFSKIDFARYSLKLITSTPVTEINKYCEKFLIPKENVTILNLPQEMVIHELNKDFIGLLFMGDNGAADIVLSTKFSEYAAAGLPVIINNIPKGAVYFVKKYFSGEVIDSPEDLRRALDKIEQNYEFYQRNTVSLFENELSIDMVSKLTVEAYQL